jgi:hypothetical protein
MSAESSLDFGDITGTAHQCRLQVYVSTRVIVMLARSTVVQSDVLPARKAGNECLSAGKARVSQGLTARSCWRSDAHLRARNRIACSVSRGSRSSGHRRREFVLRSRASLPMRTAPSSARPGAPLITFEATPSGHRHQPFRKILRNSGGFQGDVDGRRGSGVCGDHAGWWVGAVAGDSDVSQVSRRPKKGVEIRERDGSGDLGESSACVTSR